jgi:hypothetical protein
MNPVFTMQCSISGRDEQLFFHPIEDLSPGTPDLTEKLRPMLLRRLEHL